jgi:ABC-2 type transport system ATP-binding protein
MNNYYITINNLSKRFGTKQALKSINLNIQKGEIFGLVGPNGAGKTTLIKLMVGLLQPTSGTIKIFGQDKVNLTQEQKSSIGYVADEPGFYEFMTVQEIIKFNQKFYPLWDYDKCRYLIDNFNLPLREKVKNLSKGMKTQLALVLAITPNPKLLILDEPLEGLDPGRRMEFLKLLLEEFVQKEDRTIVISSHYLEELERIVDRIAFLKEGSLTKVAPMEQLKVEEKTIRVVFQKEPPVELLKMPGIKDIKREGKLCFLITIEDNFNEIFEACSRYPHYVLDVYHRNLEEFFQDNLGDDEHGF